MAKKIVLTMSLAQGRWSGLVLSQILGSGDDGGSQKSLGPGSCGATCGPPRPVAYLAPKLECTAWVPKCLAQCSMFSLRAGLASLLWPQSTSAGWSPQVLGAGPNADTQHTGEER